MRAETAPFERRPALTDRILNAAFRGAVRGGAAATLGALLGCVAYLLWHAAPGYRQFGFAPLWSSDWDAVRASYGLWPAIAGSLTSSALVLALAAFFGFSIAILLTQGFLPRGAANWLGHVVDLLAGIPSVVYGLWGVFVLGPALKPFARWLHDHLGGLPFFATEYQGLGMLPAALTLAAMVLPTVTAIARDALASVPNTLRDAALALGATRWETILRVALPAAKTGLAGALALGFGRALGETMALAMLIGNQHAATWLLLSPGTTLAALVALKFPEAGGLELSMLMYAAATLLALTMLVNAAGNAIVGVGARAARREERRDARRRADLRFRPWSRRALASTALTVGAGAAFALALLPLVSVLASILRRGTEHWRWSMLRELPPAANEGLGGFRGALIGTAAMVGMALLVAAPLGIAAGIHLSEFGRRSALAAAARFAAKALAGLPSVLAGAVAYVLVVATFKSFHPIAGALALALLMLPVIALQTEQALGMLPAGLREAARAAGATDWQTAWRVTLPAARSGIMTGVLLAAARAAGETAPLLFTALFSDIAMRDLREPVASLSVQIFNFTSVPYANQQANAWSTALALVAVVLALNVAGRALARSRP